MNIKILGTGSKGNCYIISDGYKALMLDAGLTVDKIRKGAGYNSYPVLITHEHIDHSKGVQGLLKYGYEIYMSKGTQDALGIEDVTIKTIKYFETITINDFKVTPFNSIHDCAEGLNFLIVSPSGERLLYATDTGYIPYAFKDLDYLMIEINHSDTYMILNEYADVTKRNYQRIRENHQSLEKALKYIDFIDKSKLKLLIAIHGSSTNLDYDLMREELTKRKINFKIGGIDEL